MIRPRLAVSLLALLAAVACGGTDPAAADKAKAVGGAAGALIPASNVDAKVELEAKIENAKIVSPRDAATGLPTGKRQHKPISMTKPVDEAAPITASPTQVAAPQ